MYIVFVFIVILLYFYVESKHVNEAKKQKLFCFCAFLVILFIHLFKDDSFLPDLSTDSGGYTLEFDNISKIGSIRDFFVSYFMIGGYFHEIGWSLLNYIVSRFTDNFAILQGIVSLGICAGYSYGIYKFSRSPLFSFIFLMLYQTALFQSFYVLRQHLAMALFFMLIPAIINNNYKKIIFGYAVVISLHYSAAILLPFYFYYRLGKPLFSFKRIVISVLLIICVFVLFENLTYERYADNIEREQSNALGIILTGGVFSIFAFSRDVKKNVQLLLDKYDIFIQTYMLYSVLICFAVLGTATGRLTNYFTIFLSISIPFAVRHYSKPFRLATYFVFISFCVIMALLSSRSWFQYQLLFLK